MPPRPIKAGGRQVRREKKRMMSDASRSDRPMSRVPSMPVGILREEFRVDSEEYSMHKGGDLTGGYKAAR
jgi:hypothetical protein